MIMRLIFGSSCLAKFSISRIKLHSLHAFYVALATICLFLYDTNALPKLVVNDGKPGFQAPADAQAILDAANFGLSTLSAKTRTKLDSNHFDFGEDAGELYMLYCPPDMLRADVHVHSELLVQTSIHRKSAFTTSREQHRSFHILGYIPDHTWLVKTTWIQAREILKTVLRADGDGIDGYLHRWEPAHKLSPSLLAYLSHAHQTNRDSGSTKLHDSSENAHLRKLILESQNRKRSTRADKLWNGLGKIMIKNYEQKLEISVSCIGLEDKAVSSIRSSVGNTFDEMIVDIQESSTSDFSGLTYIKLTLIAQDWTAPRRRTGLKNGVTYTQQYIMLLHFLSRLPFVHWIEIDLPATTLNQEATALLQHRASHKMDMTRVPTPFWDSGLAGSGQIISISDTGLDHDSCYFHDNAVDTPLNTVNYAHRKVISYRSLQYGTEVTDLWESENGHGTHVAGSAVGEINPEIPESNTTTFLKRFQGMAPKAKLMFDDIHSRGRIGLSLPPNLETDLLAFSYRAGARIHSASWGSSSNEYTRMSMQMDSFVSNNPDMLIVVAAGNDGPSLYSIGTPATAKNVLSVGSSRNLRSSFGRLGHLPFLVGISSSQGLGYKLPAYRSVAKIASAENPVVATPVFVEPRHACQNLSNPEDVRGKIAIVSRGECLFSVKEAIVARAGAMAMVVINYASHGSILVHMAGTSKIPSVMITNSSGNRIIEALADGQMSDVQLTVVELGGGPQESEQTLSEFSSRCCTVDFRFKPEIVAPGEYIISARSDGGINKPNTPCYPEIGNHGNAALRASKGTSMAAPLVAGAAAIVRQYFVQGWYPTGAPVSQHAHFPSASLVKATLIAGAIPGKYHYQSSGSVHGSFVKSSEKSNLHWGYGLLGLGNVLPLGSPTNVSLLAFDKQLLTHSSERNYTVLLPAFNSTWRAVLVWTDPPPAAGSRDVLVNDLDLLAIRHDSISTTVFGNHEFKRSPDRSNNVEVVSLSNSGANETWTISIQGRNVQKSPQMFALVIVSTATERVSSSHCSENCVVKLVGKTHFIKPVRSSKCLDNQYGIGCRFCVSDQTCNSNGECSVTHGTCKCKHDFVGENCQAQLKSVALPKIAKLRANSSTLIEASNSTYAGAVLSVPKFSVGLPVDVTAQLLEASADIRDPHDERKTLLSRQLIRFEPSGLQFNIPAQLTMKVSFHSIPAGYGAGIHVLNNDSGDWQLVPSAYDSSTGSVTANISHFSLYAVMQYYDTPTNDSQEPSADSPESSTDSSESSTDSRNEKQQNMPSIIFIAVGVAFVVGLLGTYLVVQIVRMRKNRSREQASRNVRSWNGSTGTTQHPTNPQAHEQICLSSAAQEPKSHSEIERPIPSDPTASTLEIT